MHALPLSAVLLFCSMMIQNKNNILLGKGFHLTLLVSIFLNSSPCEYIQVIAVCGLSYRLTSFISLFLSRCKLIVTNSEGCY